WLAVCTTICSEVPGGTDGHRKSTRRPDEYRIGTAVPFTSTDVPPSFRAVPDRSDITGSCASHLPSILAIIPALHALSPIRLAAFTMRLTTGLPASTCTLTRPPSEWPAASTARNAISYVPS